MSTLQYLKGELPSLNRCPLNRERPCRNCSIEAYDVTACVVKLGVRR